MISVRRNVFETNSSSSHSLVILTDDIIKETDTDQYFTHEEMLNSLHGLRKDGTYKSFVHDWYFGRCPFRALDTFEQKFQYAYANEDKDLEKSDLVQMLQNLIPEVKTFVAPEDAGTDAYPLHGWLDSHGITMKEFLTNKKYVIIQDGDEYRIWEDLIRSGLIDMSVIENKEDQPHEE